MGHNLFCLECYWVVEMQATGSVRPVQGSPARRIEPEWVRRAREDRLVVKDFTY
jgi:hypothetical protein